MVYKGIETSAGPRAETFRLSRFSHYFQRNGRGVFYHSLNRNAVFVPKEIAHQLKDREFYQWSDNDLMTWMQEQKFLVPIQYEESRELSALRPSPNKEPVIKVLKLILTQCCNYDCSYCAKRRSPTSRNRSSFMPASIAKQAIDRFAECLEASPNEREKSIVFHGGEPMLNMTTFRSAVKYIRKLQESDRLPRALKIKLNTNGSLITKGRADYLKQNGIDVSVSIDGREEIHDSCRHYPDRRGTFAETMRGFYLMRKAGLDVEVSCAAGPHNIRLMKDLAGWFQEELKIERFRWNILWNPPGSESSGDLYIKKLTTAILKSFQYLQKKGLHEQTTGGIFDALFNGDTSTSNCPGCGEQMVVSPDGSIGVCHVSTEIAPGPVCHVTRPFQPRNQQLFVEFTRRSPVEMNDCLDCAALGICGGGCPLEAFRGSGSIWSRHASYCTHIKAALEWFLWNYYEKDSPLLEYENPA